MKKNRRSILWGCCLCLATVLPGQSDAAVKLGQSCALTGPASFLGQQVHNGAMSYLNAHAGDEVELLVKDDGYEPIRSVENTETFLKEGIDVLFGYVGTPTSKDALPLAMENEVLFFAPFTGASFLSDAQENPYSFAVRASYDAEIENMIRHLKEDLKITRIGLFVQRDSFGMAGYALLCRPRRKLKGLISFLRYPKYLVMKARWMSGMSSGRVYRIIGEIRFRWVELSAKSGVMLWTRLSWWEEVDPVRWLLTNGIK